MAVYFSGELDANPWYRSSESADGSKALRGGHQCVLLWLVDGGMNDSDKEQNGIISDPVRLGGPTAADDDDMPDTTVIRRSGGGSISVGTLFLLMLIAIAAVLRRRKQTESFAA